MSDLNLTTAAQSIASSLAIDPRDQQSLALIQAALDAAAPLIERQVREGIATDFYWRSAGIDSALWAEAARIARGKP